MVYSCKLKEDGKYTRPFQPYINSTILTNNNYGILPEFSSHPIRQYKDTVLKPVQVINKLTINTLYPYKINFKTNEIT